jgi:hypothetical protein
MRIRFLLSACLILGCGLSVHAQGVSVQGQAIVSTPTGSPGLGVPASAPGPGIVFVSSLPINCTPGVTEPVGLSVAPFQIYYCSAPNVWSQSAPPAAPVNAPLPASTGPGPVFNVKNYGAFGDSQSSLNATPATTVLNCTDCVFTSADVGKRISCSTPGFTTQVAPSTTITSFNSATQVGLSANSIGNNPCVVLWGHSDDAAVAAALAAALAQLTSKNNAGNLGVPPFVATSTLYFPGTGGCYNLSSTALLVTAGTALSGFTIRGDGIDQSRICYNTGETAAQLINFTGNIAEATLENFTLDGGDGNQTTANIGIALNSGHNVLRNVNIQRLGVSQALALTNSTFANKVEVVSNSGSGIVCQPCQGEFYSSISSNNGGTLGNLQLQNVSALGTGEGFNWVRGLIDECSTTNSAVQLVNSVDVWLSGSFLSCSGAGSSAISVDATSYLHLSSGIASVFANDANESGLKIATGGVVESSDFTFAGTGTGNCISNSGTFMDNGANICGNAFLISSGTSAGTAAVLTVFLKTANASTNCTAGDALEVFGAIPSGYNGYYPAGATSGITAVGANTISYTTAGSNLGAASQAGYAICRNMQTFTGNLPRALLNNPIPNTCYVTITPIVNATTYFMCNFVAQSASNISRITASSVATTTCATAPIITVSNGTVSQTLTLTTGKSAWDSAIDASTGVGTTIFKPNTTITVKYDVGAASACATPPTNLSVSYNISPILSN